MNSIYILLIIMKNDFQSIEALNIYNIISELDLNTDAQETICILKNIIEINDYVEEEKLLMLQQVLICLII